MDKGGQVTGEDFLSMSDEDFSKLAPPPVSEEETAVEEPVEENSIPDESPPESTESTSEESEPEVTEEPIEEETSTEEEPEAQQEPQGEEATAVVPDPVADTTPVNYQNLYDQIMMPFKANGKMIEIRSPEELRQLAQMGANYTRKMQDIQPHRKHLLMLENNGLLDEDKLNFLIDLHQRNPEAIKKFIKDAGIDPMDIDTTSEPVYRSGNHHISNEEVSFRSQLDELSTTDEGKQTLQIVKGWDQTSREALWKEPAVMAVIHQQRESGVYDRIANEVNRQTTLGYIPAGTPFIQAYHSIGQQLHSSGALEDLVNKPVQPAAPVPVVPVATRAITPKTVVDNNIRANAASRSRSSPGKASPVINPLSMSDEDFDKQFQNFKNRV